MKHFLTIVFLICPFIYYSQADNCDDAESALEGNGISFSTIGATTVGPEHLTASCFSFGGDGVYNDIWYSYTATANTFMEWTTCGSANFDTRLAVYASNATCPLLDEDLLACSDDGVNCLNFTSRVLFEVVSGGTYLMRLGGYQEGEFGEGTFDLNAIPEPEFAPNSFCADAEFREVITIEDADNGLGWTYGNNILAPMEETQEIPFCGPVGEYYDVWYEFQNGANDSIEIRFETLTEGALYNIEVFADCDSLAATAGDGGELINNCFPTGSVSAGNILLFGFENPSEYLLRISTQITNDGPGEFRFQLVGQQEAVSVDEILKVLSMKIYPNPASSIIEIKSPFQKSVLRVLDLNGKSVLHDFFSKDRFVLDVSTLLTGMYILELSNKDLLIRDKLIIN